MSIDLVHRQMNTIFDEEFQLPPRIYNRRLSGFLTACYRGKNFPTKLRVLRYVEKLLGKKRIISNTVHDFLMACDKRDLIQRHIIYEGIWELELSDFFRSELIKHDVFLDIGANCGYFTCLALSRQIQTKTVIACEPDPLNCEILRLNLNLNQFNHDNVFILELGLGSSLEKLLFKRANVANTGVSGFQCSNPVSVFDVEVNTIDNLVFTNKIPCPTVIKMDVEGWEEHVLNGALQFLEIKPPRYIIFEATCDLNGNILNQNLVNLLSRFSFVIEKTFMSDYGCNHIARYMPS